MKILKNNLLSAILLLVLLLLSESIFAQCPMCRMTAESNLANGGTDGQGLNNGILFLLATPYFLIGGIAYFWWKNRKTEQESN